MNWFSVDEFLPGIEEEGVSTIQVLVTNGDVVAQASYALDGSAGWYQLQKLCRDSHGNNLPFEPTHWAKIPALPK